MTPNDTPHRGLDLGAEVDLDSMPITTADRITVNPLQCGGRPCVRGMRIRVSDVFDLMAAGLSAEQVVAELPDLELADVAACLRFASARASRPEAEAVA